MFALILNSMDELPDWAKVTMWLGVPSVIALGLVYQLSTSVMKNLGRIEKAVRAHEQNRARDMSIMSGYLDAICLNTASDANERARCLTVRDREK